MPIFLSFLFADPSAFGVDDKVQKLTEGKESYFVYEVNGNYFRGVEVISEIKSLWISGRTTWVLKVHCINPQTKVRLDNEVLVLKEVWIPDSVPTE